MALYKYVYYYYYYYYLTSHSGQLSLAIPLWVGAKAGEETGMPHKTLTQYPWPHTVSWYLAEDYRNGDPCHVA